VEANAPSPERARLPRAPLRLAQQQAGAAGEAPFGFEEIFFSRTDKKGKIQFGNSIFQSVSGYTSEEMYRKPHNLIRHPDMPRGLFWLMWDTIAKGEPFGAYIKNMAKDGRYYWVFAIVTPTEDGYLSVRIKPSTPALALIEKEYAALLTLEKDPKLKPAESAQFLVYKLWEHGFQDYRIFATRALAQEIKARDTQLGRTSASTAVQFSMVAESAKALVTYANQTLADYRAQRLVPLNLRLQAAQLGSSGSTIASISTTYGALSSEIDAAIGEFVDAACHVLTTVNTGLFLISVAQIQKEVRNRFQQEKPRAPAYAAEIAALDRQRAAYEAEAIQGLRAIAADAIRFNRVCANLKRAASGLETARLLGTMESARIQCRTSGLDSLLGNLKHTQVSLVRNLQDMLTLSHSIEGNALALLSRISE
jgi:PAS domain S-box-containing protein